MSRFNSLSYRLLVFAAVPVGLACGPADHVGHDTLSGEDSAKASAGAAGHAPGEGGSAASAPAAGASGSLAGSAGHAAESGGAAASSAAGGASGASGASGSAGARAVGGGGAGAGAGGAAGVEGSTAEPGAGAGAGGEASQPIAGAAANGGEMRVPLDADCDMNGVWIARLTTFSRDSVFSAVQTTSNWFYYEFEHSGRDVTVSAALDCGMQVSGSADVTLNSATTQVLLHPNDQAGRRGEFYKEADHCAFRLDRFYSVRGVSRATYLAADLSQNPELSTIQPPLPTEQSPMGAEDWDQDENPGIAFNVSGLGSRHVVQRDWNEFWSDDTAVIAPRSDEFVARANFDSDEKIIATSGGLGALLRAGATPATEMRHRILLRRLARSPSEAAAAAVRVADDLETCYKVQDSLPHDPTMQ